MTPDEDLSSAAMVVLVVVLVACFIGGMWAATRWLPPLAEGAVGTLAFFAVCGLAGASLAIFGLNVWGIVKQVEEATFRSFEGSETEIVAAGIRSLLFESGSIAALALVAYLLAPKAGSRQ